MAGFLRGLSKGIPDQFSALTFARNLHQKFLNSCFAARAFKSHSLNHRWLNRRQCCLRGTTVRVLFFLSYMDRNNYY